MSYKGGVDKKPAMGTIQTKSRIEEEYQLLNNNIMLKYDFDPYLLANETMDAQA